MVKSKEEIIREEMRDIGNFMLKLCQWAVTTLIALQTAIFFLRSAALDRMLLNGQVPKGAPLPWNVYLMGTFILSVVASLFSGMIILMGNNYRHYHALLIKNNESGLEVPPITNKGRFYVLGIFFIFPAMDILIRMYIQLI